MPSRSSEHVHDRRQTQCPTDAWNCDVPRRLSKSSRDKFWILPTNTCPFAEGKNHMNLDSQNLQQKYDDSSFGLCRNSPRSGSLFALVSVSIVGYFENQLTPLDMSPTDIFLTDPELRQFTIRVLARVWRLSLHLTTLFSWLTRDWFHVAAPT